MRVAAAVRGLRVEQARQTARDQGSAERSIWIASAITSATAAAESGRRAVAPLAFAAALTLAALAATSVVRIDLGATRAEHGLVAAWFGPWVSQADAIARVEAAGGMVVGQAEDRSSGLFGPTVVAIAADPEFFWKARASGALYFGFRTRL